ncbi:MAG: tetratricopeptide repeat protein [Candidatus Sumerlaeaceae bacterium]|jgi:tetratricopeptide (TPR) repeat protein
MNKPERTVTPWHDLDEEMLLRRGAFVVALLALVVRLAYYVELASKPYFGVPILDSRWWLDEAQRVVTSGFAAGRAFFRPPLYTLFLAGGTALLGRDTTLIVPLLQLLLGVGFCVVLVFLGTRVCNPPAGLAAGCLAALYAPLVFYEAELLSDSLALFWLTVFLFFFVAGLQRSRASLFFLAGASVGLAALTRANAFPIGLTFLVGLLLGGSCQSRRDLRMLGAGAFAAPFLILVALPTLHNIRMGDPVVICGQGGINFYLGNNPQANGANVIFPRLTEQGARYRDAVEEYAVLGYYAAQHGYDQAMLRYAAGDRPRWSDLDRYWYHQGLAFWVHQPEAAFRLYVKKLVALLNNREVRNNRDFHFAREHESLVLRLLPFGYGIALALGVCGLLAPRGMHKPGFGWLMLYLAASSSTVLLYFVAGRLRLIVLPALFIFAGIGVERLFTALAERRWREVTRSLAIILCVGAASLYPWPQFDFRFSDDQLFGSGIAATAFPAGEWAMLANASLENGHPEAAIRYASQAVTAEPGFAFGWLVLGNAALALGDNPMALDAYKRALKLEPTSLRTRNNFAVALENMGKYQRAAEVYLDVLRQDPAEPRANANLSALLYRCGDKSAARMFAQIALDSEPTLAPARAVAALTDPVSTTSPASVIKNLPQGLLAELTTPLPERIDLTSTRPVESILAELEGMTSGALTSKKYNHTMQR